MATGLFLGAGASFECGMPLVWDLTAEIRAWLTSEKLKNLNCHWRALGGGYPDEVINSVIPLLVNLTVHYEHILGSVEVHRRRGTKYNTAYNGMYVWLVDLVYQLLYQRHVLNENFITRSLRYLEGIAGLAHRDTPLWVFSLNHDLIVECVAAHYDVLIDSGPPYFGSLPLRDKNGARIGQLPIQSLEGSQFSTSGLSFTDTAKPKINLIKVHGALDVFMVNDGYDIIKLMPIGGGVNGVLQSIRAANENLIYVESRLPGGKVHVPNEIAYADQAGEMQFLRRSLLAGAFKFDQRTPQVLPHAFLDQFRNYLNRVSRLICIGYGGGDTHINSALQQWLEASADRQLELVSPEPTRTCPSFLGHVTGQVLVVHKFATDYLEPFALSPLSHLESAAKKGLRRARERQRQRSGFA
jgi:hypothetical protein